MIRPEPDSCVPAAGTFEVETPETGSIERFSGADLLVFQAATARREEPVE